MKPGESYCGLGIGDCGLFKSHNPKSEIRNPKFLYAFQSSQGQAFVEFAVIGSLALVALAFLIQMGLRANFQQQMEQDTFRLAMRVAQSEGDVESQSIQYSYFRNSQIPNPTDAFGISPRTMTQSSASVTWGEWLGYLANDRDSQPRIIVHMDNSETEFRSEDLLKNAAGEPMPLVSAVHKDLNSNGAVTQTNTGSSDATTTTETTTLTLNADQNKDGVNDQLSSSLTSTTNFNW